MGTKEIQRDLGYLLMIIPKFTRDNEALLKAKIINVTEVKLHLFLKVLYKVLNQCAVLKLRCSAIKI